MKCTKMHGLGNDFIVCMDDGRGDYGDLARILCDRRTGIGGDGLLVVGTSDVADIQMRIVNADGSEAAMCGNGIRCFSKYVHDKGIVKKDRFTVETLAGILESVLHVEDGVTKEVTIAMGKPDFSPTHIPIDVNEGPVLQEKICIQGWEGEVASVLIGVPHTEVFVEDVTKVPVTEWGPQIERHPLFPKGTNVNFVEIVDRSRIRVRTWERGCGETLACGSGSCAGVVTAYEKGLLDREVTVELLLGELYISHQEDGMVYMRGPAEFVFETDM